MNRNLFFIASASVAFLVGGTALGSSRSTESAYHPMFFEANCGQTSEEVAFVSRGNGYTLFLTANETVLSMRPDYSAIHLKLIGSNPSPRIEGLDKLPGTSNYFIGKNPASWRAGVPHYARVRYSNIYPGVDLIYYGADQHIEHDFLVEPGADPQQIRFRVTGGGKVELSGDGDLVVDVAGSTLRLRKPKIYQEQVGNRVDIDGGYVLFEDNEVGFKVGAFDPTMQLVIDPILVYSTYVGGSGSDRGLAPAVDRNGNIYITGETGSTDFPTTNPLQRTFGGGLLDVYVTKLNASGSSVVFSTYLGASANDVGLGIAVDEIGNVYVSGRTASVNFPTINAVQPVYGGGATDAFVIKLNAAGSALLYSTYLGGSSNDAAFDLRLDSTGSAYVSGRTSSNNFPTASPLQAANAGGFDSFIAKLNPAGSALVYATYLGGSGNDGQAALAIDSNGNAYLAADTSSTDFPTVNAFQSKYGGGATDAFVAKLNAAGSALIYSTYLGAGGSDSALAVAVDAAGNAYAAGRTSSTNFPTVNPLQPAPAGGDDAFVAKFNPAGSSLVYSTYFGGGGDENIFGIAADSSGNAYLSGWTASGDFPTANPLQPTYGGGATDAFITKLNPAGSAVLYSTYLGGGAEDRGDYIVLDASGSAYVTGWTASGDFPNANAFQNSYGGGAFDAFIARISEVLTDNVFHFAQAGGGGAFSTTIALTNPSATSPVNGTVAFFANDGSPLTAVVANAVVPLVIQPSRTAILSTSTDGPIRSGYARVSLTNPVLANVTYSLPGFPSLSLGPSAIGSVFLGSLSRDVGIEHGIALANTSNASARVKFSLIDSSANEVVSTLVVLAPGQQLNRFLSELMTGIPSKFVGTLRIEASQLATFLPPQPIVLAATVIEFRRNRLREIPLQALQQAP